MSGDAEDQVYDERGNVRPLGTPGAKSMSYDERVAIATRLLNGGKAVEPEPVVETKKKEARR